MNFISQILQTFKCSGTVFTTLAWYRRTDLVPLFDPKERLFENGLLKIVVQMHELNVRELENKIN